MTIISSGFLYKLSNLLVIKKTCHLDLDDIGCAQVDNIYEDQSQIKVSLFRWSSFLCRVCAGNFLRAAVFFVLFPFVGQC